MWSSIVASFQPLEDLVVLRKTARLLLGEDQVAVHEHVELARVTLGHLGLVLGRLVDLGRETRGPAVIAVSDWAVVDLDPHDASLQLRSALTC
jgi:hypothetical protein